MAEDNSQHIEADATDNSETGEEKTIFCAGFPPDVKYREIRNLFRFLDGFMYCVLNLKGKGPTVFASFINEDFSQTAIELLNGIRFDEQDYPHLELRAQLAKQNIKQPGMISGSQTIKVIGGEHNQHHNAFDRGRTCGNQTIKMIGGEHDQHNNAFDWGRTSGNQTIKMIGGEHARYPSTSSNFSTSSEITTLFVANLSVNCTERDIQGLFCREAGFRELKFNPPRSAKGKAVAFVDFVDHVSAARSLQTLNGMVIPGANNGISIQFAKANMAKIGSSRPSYPPPPFGLGMGMPTAQPHSNYNGHAQPHSNYNGHAQPHSNYNGHAQPHSNYNGQRVLF